MKGGRGRMIRKAFIMKVHEDQHEAYKLMHDEIWPDMVEMLKEHGLITYSIFLNEQTSELFGYVEVKDEERWNEVTVTEINKRWWEYMSPIMEVNEDKSPKTIDLKEVFHLKK